MRKDGARKWFLRAGLAAGGLLLVYLVAANILLGSGGLERLLSRNPARARFSWDSAYTLIPGRVTLSGFVLEGQTPGTQYRLAVDSGSLKIGLPALLGRRFLVKSLSAQGVSFHLRKQRIPGQEPRSGQEFEPPLEGMPAERPDLKVFVLSPLKHAPWRIELEGLRASELRELWLGPYRMAGDGELSGSLRLQLRGPAEIPEARLKFREISAHVGPRPAGEGLLLDLVAELHEVVPREHPGAEILGFLSGGMTLSGLVADFGFLNALFEGLPHSRFSGGGMLDLSLNLDHGEPLPGSLFRFSSEELGFHLRDLAVRGRGQVDAVVEEDGRGFNIVRLAAGLQEVALEIAGESESLLGPGLSVAAEARVAHLPGGFEGLAITVDLPESVLPDLAGLGRGLPESFPVSALPGSEARLRLRLEIAEQSASGVLELSGHGIGARVGGITVHGDLCIHGELGEGSTPANGLFFPILDLRVEQVHGSAEGQEAFDGWWAEGKIQNSRVTLGTPMTVDGAVSLRIRDAMPLIEALVPEGRSRRLAALFRGDRVVARGDLLLEEGGLSFSDLEISAHGLGRGLFGEAGFDLEVDAALLHAEHGFTDLALDLLLPRAQLPDLWQLNRFLPDELGVRFLPGEEGSLDAQFHLADGRVQGSARLEAETVALELPDFTVATDLRLDLALVDSDFSGRTLDVSGSVLRLDRLSLSGASPVRPGWWAELVFDDAQVQIASPLALDATMRLHMRDTEPLIFALAKEKGWGLQLVHLFSVEDVSASAGLKLREGDFFFDNITVKGHGTGNGALEGPGYSIVARSSRVDFTRGFETLDLSLDLPRSRLRDLATFNDYLPEASGLGFYPGSAADVEAQLELRDGVVEGKALVTARSIGVDLGRVAARGDFALELKLISGDLDTQRFVVDGTRLRIENAELLDLPNPASHGDWSTEILLRKGRAELTRPLHLSSEIELTMSDSRPLAEIFTRGRDDRWLVDLLDFRDIELRAGMELAENKVQLRRLALSANSDPDFSVFGSALRLEAQGSEIDLGGGLEGLKLRVDLPRTEVVDLGVLNRYLPESGALSFLPGGSAWVEGLFSISEGQARGEFRLDGQVVRAKILDEELSASFGLEGRVSSRDWRDEGFALEHFTLDIHSLELPQEPEYGQEWQGRISLSQGQVRLGEPIHASSKMNFSMKDSSPLVAYLARSSWWVRRLRRWLVVESIRGEADLALDARAFVIDNFRLEGKALDVRARVLLERERPTGFAYGRLHRLAVGIAFEGERRRYKIFGPLEWYQKKVAAID